MLPTIRLNDQNDYVKVAEYLTGYAERNEAEDTFTQEFQDYIYCFCPLKPSENCSA